MHLGNTSVSRILFREKTLKLPHSSQKTGISTQNMNTSSSRQPVFSRIFHQSRFVPNPWNEKITEKEPGRATLAEARPTATIHFHLKSDMIALTAKNEDNASERINERENIAGGLVAEDKKNQSTNLEKTCQYRNCATTN